MTERVLFQRFIQHLQQVRDIQRLCNVAVHARIQGVLLRKGSVLALSVCSLRSHPPLPKGEALAKR